MRAGFSFVAFIVVVAMVSTAFADIKVESNLGQPIRRTGPATLILLGADGKPVSVGRIVSATTTSIVTSYGSGIGISVGTTSLCTTPCRLTLDQGNYDLMFGTDLMTAWTYSAAGQNDAFMLKPANGPMKTAGWWMLSIGLSAAITGATMWGLSGMYNNKVYRDAGIGTLGAGVGVLVTGIILYVLSKGKVTPISYDEALQKF